MILVREQRNRCARFAEKRKKKGDLVIQDPDKGPPKGSNVIDLMAALKKSLGDEKRGKAEEEKPKKAVAKKAAAKKGTAKAPARKRA